MSRFSPWAVLALFLCLSMSACGDESSGIDPADRKLLETHCRDYLKLSEKQKTQLVRGSHEGDDTSGGIAHLVEGFTRACNTVDGSTKLLDVLSPPEEP